MIAFAAHGVAQLAALARAGALRRLVPLVLVLVAAALFVNQDIAHDDLSMSHFNLGGWHYEKARLERARFAERKAAGDLEASRAARADALRFYALAEAEFHEAARIRPEDARLRRQLRGVLRERARFAREAVDEPATPEDAAPAPAP
jgi:hypothetical protein